MKKIIPTLLPTLFLSLPLVASAQLGQIGVILEGIEVLVGYAIPVLISIALLVFFWGIVKFIAAQGSESIRADAKKIMLWGLIGLFVMVSVWGLVKFMQEALGVTGTGTPPPLPTI